MLELLVGDWRRRGDGCLALSVGAMAPRAERPPKETFQRLVEGTLAALNGEERSVVELAAILGQRLNDLVFETWAEVDVVGVCLPCDQRIGPGDKFIIQELAKLERRPILVALATKTDLVSKENHDD